MLRINNIKLNIGGDENSLRKKVCKVLKINEGQIKNFKISGKSIDARDKNNIFYVYSVDIDINGCEKKYTGWKNVRLLDNNHISKTVQNVSLHNRPVVVGSGPCGMFAALTLAQSGLRPVIIDRGKEVLERKEDVERFFQTGELNTESNVQFGEGGAGTFSDGKLTTGISNPLTRHILEEFVKFGAPEEIAFLAKPHLGTDRLFFIIQNIRKEIVGLGGEYRFSTKLTGIVQEKGHLLAVETEEHNGVKSVINTDHCILAIGHSARDTLEMLYSHGIAMEKKPFSAGLRIEHLQSDINKSQYGNFAAKLPPAEYKLNSLLPDNRGVYTFCMCPGGLVVGAASQEGGVVTNGMSYYKRDMENANSALLVSLYPRDFHEPSPLAGMYFQRELEKAAFFHGGGGYKAPFQLVGDFLENVTSDGLGKVSPTYKPGVTKTNFNLWLPDFMVFGLKFAIRDMDRRLKGFAAYDGVLTGVESRSSSPVRILRDDGCNSAVKGLYPAGEGAGYAGGIMSSAVDGIKCAQKVIDAAVVNGNK